MGPAFHKTLLPTYDVFDEDRYFEPAPEPQILELKGWRLGISICEDVWNDRDFWQRRRYHQDPIEILAKAGAQAIINLSASPFTVGKQLLREQMLGHMAREVRSAGGVRQPGGRQRRFDLRRPQRRVGCARPPVRARQGLPGRRGGGGPGAGNGRGGGGRFRSRGGGVERAGAGRARLRPEDRIHEGAAGAFRRDRFGADGGHRARMPWGRRTCWA